MESLNPNYAFRILSYEPLITISGCQTDMVFIADLALDLPEIFKDRPGLHMLLPTWNVEGQLAAQMRKSVAKASDKMPGHEFLVICNTEYEAHLLGLEAVPALFAHQGIFVNENVWKPAGSTMETLRIFDAVYNARFDEMKRHELASKIENLLLIYGLTIDKHIETATKEMRALLPQAYFANAEKGGGPYVALGCAEIVQLYAHARVGLCLSQEEGYSRVSIEYLMCGLPVVSTASIGGRDRYYSNEFCRIVENDEEAVAEGVRQLIASNHSPLDVRNHLLQMLGFERLNFLRAINRIVEDYCGYSNFFDSIKPFLGIKQRFPLHSELLQGLRAELVQERAEGAPAGRVLKTLDPKRGQRRRLVATPTVTRHLSINCKPLSADLSRALDDWRAADLTPRMFIRDDDAEAESPPLQSLISLSRWLSVPLLLATIPERCDRSLARKLGVSELVTGAVHGYSHKNYAPEGSELSELGNDRPLDVILDELRQGRDILLDVFEGRISKLLVPPWNQISDEVAEAAMGLGFTGLSSHGWERMNEPMPRINTHVDLVDWWSDRAVLGREQIEERIASELDTARELGFPFIGLVTHHRHFTDDDWQTFADIIRALEAQGVEWVAADRLLPTKDVPIAATGGT